MTSSVVLGTGGHVPARIVPNAEVAVAAGVDGAWIRRKTAIERRRWADPGESTSDLAVAAGRAALADAGVDAAQLTTIVVATSTPDRPQPPTAAYVQHRLGASGAYAFDVNAVCSGFVFALATARALLAESGGYALVVGADIYSRILNKADRRTAVLFGDGAGAVVLGPGPGLWRQRLHTFGHLSELIRVPAGGSREPPTADGLAAGRQYFEMDGRGVREFVTSTVPGLVEKFLADHGVDAAAVDHVIPHQANGVLLDQTLPRLGLTSARTHRTLTEYGNTGAAAIPLTLDHAARSGALRDGDLVLLVGFGGGMALGMGLLEWRR